MNVLVCLRIWLDDLLLRLQYRLLGRHILLAECVDESIMDKSCAFISQHASHQKVFLLLDELHPLFGKLDSLASEVPLNRLQLSFCVFACVPDFNVV